MIRYIEKKINYEKVSYTLKGFSRSGVRTGLYLEEFDIMFDGGLYFDKKPKAIFITHTHLDHCANLYGALLDNINKPFLFVPTTSINKIKNNLNSQHTLSLNKPVKFNKFKMVGLDSTCDYTINLSKKFKITPYMMDHRITTLGYGLTIINKKLNPEYNELSKDELLALKKQGTDVNILNEKPFILFCGDTSSTVLNELPFNNYAFVIIECTFIDTDHYNEASSRKHLHYLDLEPILTENTNTTFILIHFSKRYKDDQITKFFEKKNHTNVIPFI